jgi:hypothetical protein
MRAAGLQLVLAVELVLVESVEWSGDCACGITKTVVALVSMGSRGGGSLDVRP